MQGYKIHLRPLSAFSTPLRGDTLFGHLCWQVRQAAGVSELERCLEGYAQDRPFAVLSDAYPRGFLPRPTMPLHMLGARMDDVSERKTVKARRWVPIDALERPVNEWAGVLCNDEALVNQLKQGSPQPLWSQQTVSHNSINRLTNTTAKGSEGFAPFEQSVTWYHPDLELTIYALVDERMSGEALKSALEAIGQSGYGKEASSGLGKFDVISTESWEVKENASHNAFLTLAPCAPQNGRWEADDCYYQTHVRFGYLGAEAASIAGSPWKNPLLLADSAALLKPESWQSSHRFIGQGLIGLVPAMPEVVHQGYSPVMPVSLLYPKTEEVA